MTTTSHAIFHIMKTVRRKQSKHSIGGLYKAVREYM